MIADVLDQTHYKVENLVHENELLQSSTARSRIAGMRHTGISQSLIT